MQRRSDVMLKKEVETQAIQFVVAGGEPQQTAKSEARLSLISSIGAWKMMVDLGHSLVFPVHIAVTRPRPDLVFRSDQEHSLIIAELTVPLEGNFSWASKRKKAKYSDLFLFIFY